MPPSPWPAQLPRTHPRARTRVTHRLICAAVVLCAQHTEDSGHPQPPRAPPVAPVAAPPALTPGDSQSFLCIHDFGNVWREGLRGGSSARVPSCGPLQACARPWGRQAAGGLWAGSGLGPGQVKLLGASAVHRCPWGQHSRPPGFSPRMALFCARLSETVLEERSPARGTGSTGLLGSDPAPRPLCSPGCRFRARLLRPAPGDVETGYPLSARLVRLTRHGASQDRNQHGAVRPGQRQPGSCGGSRRGPRSQERVRPRAHRRALAVGAACDAGGRGAVGDLGAPGLLVEPVPSARAASRGAAPACTQTVAPRFWRPGAPGPGASRGVRGTCPRPRSWTCGWPSPPGVVTRSSLCVSVPGSPLMRTPVHTGLGHLTTSVQARFQVQAHPKELGLRPPTRPQWGSLRVFAIEEKWGDL